MGTAANSTTPDPLGRLRYLPLVTLPVGIVAFVIMITGTSGWTYVGAFLLLAWAALEVVLGITLRRRLQQGKATPESP
jgi:hypothetical protein